MASPESYELSDVRASRKVYPNASLRKFFAQAVKIGDDVFGYSDSALHRRVPTELELMANPDAGEEYEGLGVSSVMLYSAAKLRVTLFQCYAESSAENNQLLNRLHARMSAARFKDRRRQQIRPNLRQWVTIQRDNPLPEQLKQIEVAHGIDSEDFTIATHNVAVSSQDEFKHLGVEYVIKIAESPEARVLEQQGECIFETARRTAAGSSLLHRDYKPTPVLELPFMRAPRATEELHEQFAKELNVYAHVDNLQVGPIRWNLST